MKTNFLIPILLCLLFSSCTDGLLKDSDVPEAKRNIIEKGDKFSYGQLYIYFSRKEAPDELLAYSMIMAYKYNSADGYFNIFESIIRIHNKNNFQADLIKNLDSTSREFALNSLKKSGELGNLYAKKILAIYYREGKYLPMNIELAKKYEEENEV